MKDEQPSSSQLGYITLKEVEREIGISRVTLKKYCSRLGIKPISFHVKDRSLYITREAVERVKQFKQHPEMLDELRYQ